MSRFQSGSVIFNRLYMDLCPSYVCICFSLNTAGLRRSFRLRKDRQGSSGEPQTPDSNHTEFLIYEEVTQYLPRPGDRPRLIVLIGRFTVGFGDVEDRVLRGAGNF